MRARRDKPGPWFLVVATNAPHKPSFAAKRHQNLFRKAKMPKPASFNEADVSDKSAWIRSKPRLDAQGIAKTEEFWRKQQRSLQSVDDLVSNLVRALADTGQLRTTYVVYTSDNGYMHYRHRVMDKGVPYEESIGVPLIVRGPGVPRGQVRHQLVSNTDWAPTIARWARVQPPDFVDGRSFSPLLSSSPPPWRKQLLIEFFLSDHAFSGLRTSNGRTYVEYDETITALETQLRALKGCKGQTCKTAEN